ncbi:MAG: hypothetical protein JWP78_2091 [Mucilaginibacter sp.]|nr:hypothetical protein [Mucilaginibacter sp.]
MSFPANVRSDKAQLRNLMQDASSLCKFYNFWRSFEMTVGFKLFLRQ